MTDLKTLKAATSLRDLALILHVRPAALAFILHQLPDQNKYSTFEIKKKSGGMRTISAPDMRLKMVQRRLADFLQLCQVEVEKAEGVEEDCVVSHGFRRGHSIATNAGRHRARRWVFNLDLEEFFPTINFGRVYGFFTKNRHYALAPKVAATIAKIACFDNKLPQGSPCSPIISNMIANVMDVRLAEIAQRAGCSYTRYADDLTFSTNERDFPGAVARRNELAHQWVVGREVKRAIRRSGFTVNDGKTRMQYRTSRQEVTGLVVNSRVNVKSDYYKVARAMTHYLVTGGKPVSPDGKSEITRPQLRGMLAFVHHIKSAEDIRIGLPPPEQGRSYDHLYCQFLDYDWFYGIDRPTLICEGKTDNIYLAAAIKSQAAAFPSLIKTNGGVISVGVRFFKYSPAAALIQKLSGGAGELSNLLSSYRSRTKTFKGRPPHPAIIVVDNDSGAKSIYSHIKSITKSVAPVDGTKQFYFIYQNLYVVPVPTVVKGDTPIERLFDPALLATKLGGRELDLTGTRGAATHYSKNDFAVHVVKKGGTAVNFDGFDPLLAALVAVKDDYAKRP